MPTPQPISGSVSHRRPALPLVGLVFIGMGAVGCATAGTKAGPTAEEQQATIESLRIQNAGYVKQIEELENRVFILSDKVESRRVNAEKVAAPQLPRVTLHKGEGTLLEGGEPGVILSPDDPNIEFAGEAARKGKSRPVLRLAGNESDVSLAVVATSAAPHSESGPGHTRAAVEGEPRRSLGTSPPLLLYRQAQDQLNAGHYDEAKLGFRQFVHLYPSHEYADNAQYWLAECDYAQKQYPDAVKEFRRVVEEFPQGNKVPDALLKIGFSYLAMGGIDAGRETLNQLVRSYPRHEAAALAHTRLGELEIRPAVEKRRIEEVQ